MATASTALGAGVTLITHGLNGNTVGWINAMATQLTKHPDLPGARASYYRLHIYRAGDQNALAWMRQAGSPPTATDSGEIVVALDWSLLSDGNSYSTDYVAEMVSRAFRTPGFLSELGGRSLAEFPIHLIGHSRGGSLVCELARLLGIQGIWVDQVTTLDPRPLNNDCHYWDWLLYSVRDAPVRAYLNVLFHDNYWQSYDLVVGGDSVGGAYNRQLNAFSGGYDSGHSDVHLWYHATIDTGSFVSDSEAVLDAGSRSQWFSDAEARGARAGYYWSRTGRGDRLRGAVREGYNQCWDLGAGTVPNRSEVGSNLGEWPNVLSLALASTNVLLPGTSVWVNGILHWARPSTRTGEVTLYLDANANPLDGNEKVLGTWRFAGSDASRLRQVQLEAKLPPSAGNPGRHHLFVRYASDDGRSRLLYVPEPIEIRAPVRIVSHPKGSTIAAGGRATFVVVAEGVGPLRYQWRRNGAAIPGAVLPSYTIANAQPALDGVYTVVVSNGLGAVTSDPAEFQAVLPPRITLQPTARTVPAQADVVLSVEVTGTPPFVFEWWCDGRALSRNTNSLRIPAATPADSGVYQVSVSNLAAVVTSRSALVTVYAPLWVGLGSASNHFFVPHAPLGMSLLITGTPPVRCQWRKEAVPIPGATNGWYRKDNAGPADVGAYDAVVSDAFGRMTSSVVRARMLPVNPTLTIVHRTNECRIIWPAAYAETSGYLLESSTNPPPSGSWQSEPWPSWVEDDFVVLTLPALEPRRFFRLRRR